MQVDIVINIIIIIIIIIIGKSDAFAQIFGLFALSTGQSIGPLIDWLTDDDQMGLKFHFMANHVCLAHCTNTRTKLK